MYNSEFYCDINGGLYQWDEMMEYGSTPAIQGICPQGWHLPTDNEWKYLEGTVDSQYGIGNSDWNFTGWRGDDAGGNLKDTASIYWDPPNTGATNTSGFTALGAGYSIAMRDLEIRGSGDILGTRQHGYIAAVGFHLYTRLLADAVKRMNKQKPGSMSDQELPFQILRPLVQIDLPLPVGIPEDYIADRSVRLGLYRRAASILQREEIQQLKKEFTDRFGSIPEPVKNLLIQLEIKLLAEKAGLEGISIQSGQINLQYPEGQPLPQPWEFETRVRFGESSVWIPLDLKNRAWVMNLLAILEGLTSY